MPILHSLSDYLEIIYHRDYRILIGRFLRPLSEAENEQCYLDLLAAAQQHGSCRYWLLDIRRRDRSGPLTLAWLLNDFYPRLVRELGSPVRVVYFMAPNLRQEFQVDGTIPEPNTYEPNEPFRMNQCITEGEAVRWLLAEQKAQAA
ncbi:MAG: hypothetical protein ACRYFK_10590 [Janthinobacterium lividum]